LSLREREQLHCKLTGSFRAAAASKTAFADRKSESFMSDLKDEV
jgi:hypothetical protein